MLLLKKAKNVFSRLFSFDVEELETIANRDPEGARSFLDHSYLTDLFPYRLYDPETHIFENEHSYGFGFLIPPLAGATKAKEEELEQLISSLFYEGAACQFLLFADPFIGPLLDDWGNLPPNSPAITSRTIERRKAFYDLETLGDDPVVKVPLRNFSLMISYSAPKNGETKAPRFQSKLMRMRRGALNILARLVENEHLVHALTPYTLIQCVSHLTGIDFSIHSPAPKSYNDQLLIHDQIKTGGGIEVAPNGCLFRGKRPFLFKMFQVTEMPPRWHLWNNVELIGDHVDDGYRLQTPFFIHYGIAYAPQAKVKSSLVSKEMLLKNQLGKLSFLKKNPQMIEESAQYNYALRQYEKGEKFVITRLNVGIWGSVERFQDSASALVALYQKNDLKLEETTFLHFDDFVRSLPMSWGDSKALKDVRHSRTTHTSMTSHVACFAPVVADFCGFASKGIPLISRRGQLTFFDPFVNHTKAHTSVIGPTGSGKSFFLAEMMRDFRARKRRVFVIDKGGSFRQIAALHQGQYISFEPGESLHLNPFSFLNADLKQKTKDEKEDPFSDMMETLKAIIRTMYKPSGEIEDDYKTTLDKAVELAFKAKGCKARIDDVIAVIQREFTYATDTNNAKKEKLIERLGMFASDGCYSSWLYGKTAPNFQGDFIIIETNNLESVGDLKPVILQTYFLMISNEIYSGDRSVEKAVIIDECHNLIKERQWAYTIQLGTREYRKFNAAMILATQRLKDFSSKEAREAFCNSEWIITIGNGSEALSTIKEDNLLQIDPYEEEMLLSLRKEKRFSEVAIRSESSKHTTAYRFRIDPFSLQLFSTNAADYERFKVMREKGYEIESVIDWMIPLKETFREMSENHIPVRTQIETLLTKTGASNLKKRAEALR